MQNGVWNITATPTTSITSTSARIAISIISGVMIQNPTKEERKMKRENIYSVYAPGELATRYMKNLDSPVQHTTEPTDENKFDLRKLK